MRDAGQEVQNVQNDRPVPGDASNPQGQTQEDKGEGHDRREKQVMELKTAEIKEMMRIETFPEGTRKADETTKSVCCTECQGAQPTSANGKIVHQGPFQ